MKIAQNIVNNLTNKYIFHLAIISLLKTIWMIFEDNQFTCHIINVSVYFCRLAWQCEIWLNAANYLIFNKQDVINGGDRNFWNVWVRWYSQFGIGYMILLMIFALHSQIVYNSYMKCKPIHDHLCQVFRRIMRLSTWPI